MKHLDKKRHHKAHDIEIYSGADECKKNPGNRSEGRSRFTLSGVMLGAMVVGAFLLRVLPQWDKVFVDGVVWFRGVDSWYHMRMVDNMMSNFPFPVGWDMYAMFPGGFQVGFYPLMSWVIAGFSIFGFDYEVVGALFPPLLGVLILIPIYLLGKELFGKGVGLAACLLVAVLPGELLHRSLLGFTDQHIMESLLMVTTILLLVKAYRNGKRKYIIWTGVTLGLYCLNWHGSAFFLFILGVWFMIDFILRYLKGGDTCYLCKLVSLMSAVTLVVSLPYLLFGTDSMVSISALLILIVGPWALFYLVHMIRRKVFLISLGFVSVTTLILLCLPFYGLPFWGMQTFSIAAVFWGFGSFIEETSPVGPQTAFSLYGIPILLFFLGLYFLYKRKEISLPFVVWTIILLVAAVSQRRWGYYFTVPLSLVVAYAIVEAGKWVRKDLRTGAVVVMCFFMIMPTIRGTVEIATLLNNIDEDWYNACVWLRENTPDPFPRGAYYELGVDDPDYGVLAWWDYGHWIIRIGRRVPVSSPTFQGRTEPSQFFVAQSEDDANKALKGLDIRYVIMDEVEVTGKFYAIVQKAMLPEEDTEELRLGSMAVRLWTGRAETWALIHQEGRVKIFENVQPPTEEPESPESQLMEPSIRMYEMFRNID